MADKSRIEWTEATWNPIRGCSKVSSGCTHCYAETMASRFSGPGLPYEGLTTDGRWNGTARLVPERMDDPMRWKRPRRIFVNSMSDLFHESLAFEDIAAIFGVMAVCPQHTFQVLTKRVERMGEFFSWLKGKGYTPNPFDKARVTERMTVLMAKFDFVNHDQRFGPWPLPNVWIGASVENQDSADLRVPLLLEIPAAVRWLSCEPLLGPVDLGAEYLALRRDGRYPFPMLEDRYRTKLVDLLDWVVVGGESGAHARPMNPEWALDLRDQSAAAGVPFLFKQWGEFCPPRHLPDNVFQAWDAQENAAGHPDWDRPLRFGKKASGRLLNGQLHDGYPIAPTRATA